MINLSEETVCTVMILAVVVGIITLILRARQDEIKRIYESASRISEQTGENVDDVIEFASIVARTSASQTTLQILEMYEHQLRVYGHHSHQMEVDHADDE